MENKLPYQQRPFTLMDAFSSEKIKPPVVLSDLDAVKVANLEPEKSTLGVSSVNTLEKFTTEQTDTQEQSKTVEILNTIDKSINENSNEELLESINDNLEKLLRDKKEVPETKPFFNKLLSFGKESFFSSGQVSSKTRDKIFSTSNSSLFSGSDTQTVFQDKIEKTVFEISSQLKTSNEILNNSFRELQIQTVERQKTDTFNNVNNLSSSKESNLSKSEKEETNNSNIFNSLEQYSSKKSNLSKSEKEESNSESSRFTELLSNNSVLEQSSLLQKKDYTPSYVEDKIEKKETPSITNNITTINNFYGSSESEEVSAIPLTSTESGLDFPDVDKGKGRNKGKGGKPPKGSRVARGAKGLLKGLGKVAGPIALAFAAYDGITSAMDDKSIKEATGKEEVSETDRIAGGVGGVLGGVVGLGDSLLGLAGIETNMGDSVKQLATSGLSRGADWTKELLFGKVDTTPLKPGEVAKPQDNGLIGNSLDWFSQKFPELSKDPLGIVSDLVSSGVSSIWNFGKETVSQVAKDPLGTLSSISPIGMLASGVSGISSLIPDSVSSGISSVVKDPIGAISSGVAGISSLIPDSVSSGVSSIWNFGKETVSQVAKDPLGTLSSISPIGMLASGLTSLLPKDPLGTVSGLVSSGVSSVVKDPIGAISSGVAGISSLIPDSVSSGVAGISSLIPDSVSSGVAGISSLIPDSVSSGVAGISSLIPDSVSSGVSSIWNFGKETVSQVAKDPLGTLSSISPIGMLASGLTSLLPKDPLGTVSGLVSSGVSGISSLLPKDPLGTLSSISHIGMLASGVSGISSLIPDSVSSNISSLASSTISNISNSLPSSKDISSSMSSIWNFGKETVSNITKNPLESLTSLIPVGLGSSLISNLTNLFSTPESSTLNVLGNSSESVLNSTKQEMNKLNSTISEPTKQFEKQKSELLENKVNTQSPVIIPIPPPSVIVNSPKDNSVSIIQPSSPDPTSIRDIMMGLQLAFA